MGEDERQVGETVTTDQRTPEQIEADIERTRRELGDTVAAVAQKADVKAQAKAKADELKQRATEKKDEFTQRAREAAPESGGEAAAQAQTIARENRTPLIIGAAVLVAFVLGRRSAR